MALPLAWPTVPITGEYVGLDGTPVRGSLVITAPAPVVVDGVLVVPAVITIALDPDGAIPEGTTLPASDAGVLDIAGWAYTVREQWVGGRVFSLVVPAASAGLSLSDAAPAVPVQGYARYDASRVRFDAGASGLLATDVQGALRELAAGGGGGGGGGPLPTLAPVAYSGAYGDLTGRPSLATVATTGAYAHLIGAPALHAVATSGQYSDLMGRPALAAVATSGAYADLSGRPALGTAAAAATGDFATAAQGALAATALQPGANISVLVNNSGFIADAPADGTYYTRRNNAWEAAPDGGGGSVTSVQVAVPASMTASGGPITGSGTITLAHNTGFAGYTTTEQTKLAGIAAGATVGATWASTLTGVPAILTALAGLSNASGALTNDGSGALSWVPAGGGGTVTSVGLSVPTGFAVGGTPVTTSGTLALTYAAGFVGYTTTEQTKLAGIATGATAVAGSTSITISGGTAQRAALTGDVTAAANNNATTIANGVVTNAKMASMATMTLRGRNVAGTGVASDLTVAQVRTMLNVADGATANAGTVTSVNLGNSTGLTASGGPVTGSGSLTYTLSANLQGWHALAPAAKANVGYTIVTEASAFTATRATHAGADKYTRAGGNATFDSAQSYAAGDVVKLRATGAVTLIGTGVTLTPPAGGTLGLTAGMAVEVIFVTATTADVVGQTVAA